MANPAGPQCRAVDDAIEVTFWWRDPADETRSPIVVWLYHRRDRPPSDARARPTLLAAPTHGSGALRCPTADPTDDDEVSLSADAPDRAATRRLAQTAAGDSRSAEPAQLAGGRGHGVSARDAAGPAQPAGTRLMRRILPPVALSGAARRATIAGSGSTPPARLSTRNAAAGDPARRPILGRACRWSPLAA